MQFIITTLCAFFCLSLATPIYIDDNLKGTMSLTTLLPDEQIQAYFTLYEKSAGKPGYGSNQQLFPEFCIFAGQPCSIPFIHSIATPVQDHRTIYGYVLVSFSQQPRNNSELNLKVGNTLFLHLWTNFEQFQVYKSSFSEDQELLNRTIEAVQGPIMELRNTNPTEDMRLGTVFGTRFFTLKEFRKLGNGTKFVIPDPRYKF